MWNAYFATRIDRFILEIYMEKLGMPEIREAFRAVKKRGHLI